MREDVRMAEDIYGPSVPNLQGKTVPHYIQNFESLLMVKRLWRSHWTPVNMTKDLIECYDNLNTRGCSDELIFGDSNEQPIPFDYYNFLNDDDENGNNIPGTLVDNDFLDNEGVEERVVLND